MPVFVSLHTCFTWPFSVDFDVFKLYLEGYSVEEAVEQRSEAIKTANANSLKASYRMDNEDKCDERTAFQKEKHVSGGGTSCPVENDKGQEPPGLSNASMLKMEGARKDEELLLPISAATCVTQPSTNDGAATFHVVDTKTNAKIQGGAADGGTAKGDKSKRKESKHRHSGKHHSKKKRKEGSFSPKRVKAPRPFYMSEEFLDFQNRVQHAEHQSPSQIAVFNSKLLYDEVNEQYELFNILQQDGYLSAPYAFLTNHYLPIPVPDRCRMVEMYYELLAPVCCCFFGSRMSKYEGVRTGSSTGSGTNAFTSAIMSLFGSKGSAALNSERNQMYTARNEAMVRRLQELRDGSLRRQWENIKKVCATVSLLYQGKGGLYVPRSTPLLYTVRQCYGLTDQAAHHYATMAFGYEHHLDINMMNRLRSFEEYSTICTLIASLWCDASELLLRDDFVDGCQRIATLLEETRTMGELHALLFGEALRPRWQMQLDEVQRVITTTSTHDKAALSEPGAAHSPSCPSPFPPGATSGVASPVTPSVQISSFERTLLKNASQGSSQGAAAAAPPYSPHSSNNVSAYGISNGGANTSTTIMGAAAAANTSSTPFCGNKMFSRRFMVEFPYLIKHLSRLAASIGPSKNLNLALDTFYNRIFTYLESLSTRTAPAIVSKVMSLHHHKSAAAASRGGGGGGADGGENSPMSASLRVSGSRPGSYFHQRERSSDAVELINALHYHHGGRQPHAHPTGTAATSAPIATSVESATQSTSPAVAATTTNTSNSTAAVPAGEEEVKSRGGLRDAAALPGLVNSSFPVNRSMHEDLAIATDLSTEGKPRRMVKSTSQHNYELDASPALNKSSSMVAHSTDCSFHHGYDAVEHVLEPLTSIVNTSMAHPAVALLQLASASAASPTGQPGTVGSTTTPQERHSVPAVGSGASENDVDMPLPRVRSVGEGALDSSTVSLSSRGSSFALHAHDAAAHHLDSNGSNNSTHVPHHAERSHAAPAGGVSNGNVAVPDLSASPTGAVSLQLSSSEAMMSSSGTAMPDTPRSKHAASKSKVRHLVQKALDKRYLIELCLMFTLLPTLWPQLSSISAEDHKLCDKSFVDLALALKSITQVLMASDDYAS